MSHLINKNSACSIIEWVNEQSVNCKYICDDLGMDWNKGFSSVSERLSQLHDIVKGINYALANLKADGYVVREHKVDSDISVSPTIFFFIDDFDDGE